MTFYVRRQAVALVGSLYKTTVVWLISVKDLRSYTANL